MEKSQKSFSSSQIVKDTGGPHAKTGNYHTIDHRWLIAGVLAGGIEVGDA